MKLSNISKIIGNKMPKKRIGRGGGSGKGFHTVGKGNKGQNARSGHGIPVGFEGGQVPLYKKLPKIRGFKRSYKTRPVILNLGDLNIFNDGEIITPQVLFKKGLIGKIGLIKGIKILGDGILTKKLRFSDVLLSKTASEKIKAL
jgi:large subunit ribosomal protein L15